jgi:hypothetical protein
MALYEGIEEMQIDLDDYIKLYYGRVYQGRNMNGRTPYQTFVEGIKPLDKEENDVV